MPAPAIALLVAMVLSPVVAAADDTPGLYELRAVGMTFAGPKEIPHGWTTFRFTNASAMTHFAMIDVPPPGVSQEALTNDLSIPFQHVMDAMIANDQAAIDAAFATFPPWVADLGRNGGPGLLSPGLTGDTTVYLAPGRYLLECYVKMDGVFHTTPQSASATGMVLALTVTETANGAPEPAANATIGISNSAIELIEGALKPGENTIRVNFSEQQALPSFVGNDVHLLRIHSEADIGAAAAWMDWRTPNGLQDPSPVEFLGGVQDMPAGSHAYFSATLAPGAYALMAEVPDPQGMGLVMTFTID